MAWPAPATISGWVKHAPVVVQEVSQNLAPFITKGKLGNGLRIASEKVSSDISTVGVFFDAGSRAESKSTKAAAFALQHALLNPKRGLVKKFKEQTGGKFGAYLTRDTSAFYVKVTSGDVPKAVELLGQALSTPFEESEIAAIRDHALATRRNFYSPAVATIQQLHEGGFHGGSLANDPYGDEETIKGLTAEALNKYKDTQLTGGNGVLVAVGDVDAKDFQSKANESLGKLSADVRDAPTARFTGCDQKLWNEYVAHPYVAIGYVTPGITHPDQLAFRAWSAYVGRWTKEYGYATGSGIARELALGDYAESIHPIHYAYPDVGVWGVLFEAAHDVTHNEHDGAQGTLEKVFYELTRAGKALREDDVLRAKYILRGRVQQDNDGLHNSFQRLGEEFLRFDTRIDPVVTLARIDALSRGDLLRVADQYMYDAEPVVASVGPVEEILEYTSHRRFTYWWRD